MRAVDQWLKKNAVECSRMGALLTPKACSTYRAAEPVACKGCDGLGAEIDAAEAKRVAPNRPSRLFAKKPEERRSRTCGVKGCKNKHVARGLCGRHYAQRVANPARAAARKVAMQQVSEMAERPMEINVKMTRRNIEDAYGGLTGFAASAGVSQPTVSKTLHGKTAGRKAKAVLFKLEIERLVVWGRA